MANDRNRLAGSSATENTGGLLTGFLAEENVFDRRSLWRLGSWGAASVGAVTLALLANQSSIGWRRDQVAAADLARQSQQIQSLAKESQGETRRLASAIETLNSDRDRLYSRVTVLEQGLDSVTGAIARQNSALAAPQALPPVAAQPVAAAASTQASSAKSEPPPASQNLAPAPVVAPVAMAAPAEKLQAEVKSREQAPVVKPGEPAPETVASIGQTASDLPAAPPLMTPKSMMAPPGPAAAKLIEPEKPVNATAAAPAPEATASAGPAVPDAKEVTSPKLAVQRTQFGVDVGGANSVGGLRALWRGLLKWRSNAALTTLRPIIVIKEGTTGLGMQLRLVAGPIDDAAAAAKICAGLVESQRKCETTVFDGQRLTMGADEPQADDKPPTTRPETAKPTPRRRSPAKQAVQEEPPKTPDPPSALSSLFGRR